MFMLSMTARNMLRVPIVSRFYLERYDRTRKKIRLIAEKCNLCNHSIFPLYSEIVNYCVITTDLWVDRVFLHSIQL